MSRKVTFKLLREGGGGTASLTVAENIAWPVFIVEAERATGIADMKYKYIDSDGDEVNMDTPEELEEAIRWMTRKGNQDVLPDAPVVIADQESGGVHCSDSGDKQQEQRPSLIKDVRLFRAESERLVQHGDSPLLLVRHDGVRCDYCGSDVVGVRYKCGICTNYDLCEACEQLSEEIHPPGHAFIKMRRSSAVAGRTSDGILVPLLVGSPYEKLPDVTMLPYLPFDETTVEVETAVRKIACRRLAGTADHLRRKLEKLRGQIYRNELRRAELEARQMRLRERLDKIMAAALAESGRRRCIASGPDGNDHQEFAHTKCAGKKFDQMHRIGNAVKHEKPVEMSKDVCRRAAKYLQAPCCRHGELQQQQPQGAAAAAATEAAAAAAFSSDDADAPEPFFRYHLKENKDVVSLRGFRAACESEETFPNGTKVAGGTKFVQRWMLHNNGSVTWDKHTTLKMAFGTIPCSIDEIALPPLAPGERALVSVEFQAPYEEGFYRSMWQPCHRGRRFGQDFWCRIMVVVPVMHGNQSKTPHERLATGPVSAAAIVPEQSAFETDDRAAASVAVVTAATVAADLVTSAVPKPCEAGGADMTGPKAGVCAASSLEAACDLMHLKMLATSQTATPNNTPLAMSPPKSPEPFAVRTHLANASTRGNSLVSGTAFEAWEHAAERGDKSDHTYSRVMDESDSEDDCCYNDDFVIVPVPACFNLQVPYVPHTVEILDASPSSEAAGGRAAALPACGVASPPAAEVPTAGSDDLTESCRSAVAGDGAAVVHATVVSTTSSAPESVQTTVAFPSCIVAATATDTSDRAIGSVCLEQTAVEPPSATASAVREVEPSIVTAPGCTVSATVAAARDGCCTASDSVEEQSAIEPPSVVVPPGGSAASLCETGVGECRSDGPSAERDEAGLTSPHVETQRGRSAGFVGLLTKARDFLGEILKSADQAYADGSAAAVPAAAHQSAGEQRSMEHGAADSPAASQLQHFFTDAAYDENMPILYPPESPLEQFVALDPPESPLEQLVAMGFANRPLNTALQQKHNGDIDAVLRELLDELDNDWHTRRH